MTDVFVVIMEDVDYSSTLAVFSTLESAVDMARKHEAVVYRYELDSTDRTETPAVFDGYQEAQAAKRAAWDAEAPARAAWMTDWNNRLNCRANEIMRTGIPALREVKLDEFLKEMWRERDAMNREWLARRPVGATS